MEHESTFRDIEAELSQMAHDEESKENSEKSALRIIELDSYFSHILNSGTKFEEELNQKITDTVRIHIHKVLRRAP